MGVVTVNKTTLAGTHPQDPQDPQTEFGRSGNMTGKLVFVYVNLFYLMIGAITIVTLIYLTRAMETM